MARVSLSNLRMQYDRLEADTNPDMDTYIYGEIAKQVMPPKDPRITTMTLQSLRDQYVHATHTALRERNISVEGSSSIAESVYLLIGMLLVEQMQLKDQIAALRKERERVA